MEELEGVVWGEPEFQSYLVRTCHRLRRKPITEFTVEDLRIMIGQGFGLVHLLPLAVEVLKADPFAQGDFYPGDLLKNVLNADLAAFPDDGTLVREIGAICRAALEDSSSMEQLDHLSLADFRALILEFAQRQ